MRRCVETVIVGAGHAGLALSWALTEAGREHVLLERGRVGERWRSARWDSLALLTPNWANRLPGDPPPADPDAFEDRAGFVARLDAYARSFDAPVLEHTPVTSVERHEVGFRVRTEGADLFAANVVVATGWCDVPAIPAAAAGVPDGVAHLHTAAYRNPAQLAPGGVLVVGAGATGQQLAYELAAAGRDVTLASGKHSRAVRRYRGRDTWAWMRDLGILDDEQRHPRRPPEASLPLDGRGGGRDLDLGVLQRLGVRLAGRVERFDDHGRAHFDAGLPERVEDAERRFRRLLERIDRHVAEHALRLPAAPAIPPVRVDALPRALDLRAEGIGTVLWATGYRRHHPWLRVPVAPVGGDIVHERGLTAVPGLYVLGMQWQTRRISHQIGGVGPDALAIADHIVSAGAVPTRLRRAA
jgi:putative flavoprotein involved in K+ transport